MVEYLELNINELLLDQDNPRVGSVSSQSQALEAIIHLNDRHFRNLMLSIKDDGLDPGDNFYVIQAQGEDDFVVLEGNRRLSALMVLNNQDILNGTEVSAAIKTSLVRAATGFDRAKVEPIRCVQFEDRKAANEWIYRRHAGGAAGEGRIPWGPLEIQRFSGDRSVLDVIDFVGRNADYSEADWESTKSMIESRRSSSLTRLLESAHGRKHLGISISSSKREKIPLLAYDPKWALKVLRRIIEDVRDGVEDTRSLNTATDIEKYFKNLPKNLQPPKNPLKKPRPFKDINFNPPPTAPGPRPKTTPRTSAVPRPRKYLAPKRHQFKVPNSTKGEALLREAGTLDANKFTLSAAFLLRGFIELAINDYMDVNGLPTSEINLKGHKVDLNLTEKGDRVLKHISASKTFANADLRGFRNHFLGKTSTISIQSLNGFVHNKFQIPTPDTLRAGWDSSVPIFMAAYGKL